MTQKAKRWLSAILLWVAVVVLMSAVSLWNPLEKAQLNFSNGLYYERPTNHPVVIVEIDQNTINAMGNPAKWCRQWYGQVVENIEKYGPAAVGLDLNFKSPSQGICQSELEKISQSANSGILLKQYLEENNHPSDVAFGNVLAKYSNVTLLLNAILDAKNINYPEKLIKLEEAPAEPVPSVAQNVKKLAHQLMLGDKSGMIRQALPVLFWQEKFYLSFALENVLQFLKVEKVDQVKIDSDQLIVSYSGGTLEIPLENYQMNINFTAKPEMDPYLQAKKDNIRIVPFVDVFNDNYKTGFDPNYFKDKIVLIGAYYETSGDKYITPIDAKNYLYGVMIHAEAIQTILDKAWLRNASLIEQFSIIGLLAGLALWAVYQLRLRTAGMAVLVGGALYLWIAAPIAFRGAGVILNLVYPPLGMLVAVIAGYAYRYFTEFKQKTQVAKALGKYVNEVVAAKVLEEGEKATMVGGEKRSISVIFTDIRGFTSISESLQPQSLVALLNEYFEVMAAIIIRNGGIIDKFEGDAIMAIFGTNEKSTAHAEQACLAALEMQAALPELMEKWKNDPALPGGEKKPEIDFRVGVSSGDAIVGNMGAQGKIEFTAMGDIVNLGSRLESANKKYLSKIMVSEATYEAAKENLEFRFMDMIRVKGKNQAIKIYELLAEKGQLSNEQQEIIKIYNKGLKLYFERKFIDALQVFEEEILKRWPNDHLTEIYAGRCELLKRYPPRADWDFVYSMQSK